MTTPTDEPTYYVTTAFSGVGFSDPENPTAIVGDKVVATVIPAEQIDTDIREQGRAWLAERRA